MSDPSKAVTTCGADWPHLHTHLLCPDCASETVKNGYASHWWCEACGAPNAQAVIVCSPTYGQKVVGSSPSQNGSSDQP